MKCRDPSVNGNVLYVLSQSVRVMSIPFSFDHIVVIYLSGCLLSLFFVSLSLFFAIDLG